jgi:hypothetical protein
MLEKGDAYHDTIELFNYQFHGVGNKLNHIHTGGIDSFLVQSHTG